jgi:hypothetical protein
MKKIRKSLFHKVLTVRTELPYRRKIIEPSTCGNWKRISISLIKVIFEESLERRAGAWEAAHMGERIPLHW